MIDHYHNLKVRYASLKGAISGESIELITPIFVLLIVGAVALYFLNPLGLGGFAVRGLPVGLSLLLGAFAAVFFVLAYMIEIFPKTALWSLVIAGTGLAVASIPFTVWLHDELRYAALQFQVDAPSALAIGAVFFLYGAIIAAYAAFGLSSYAT